mmetsp:Transcript_25897/g.50600  ORF Transcript_25897/g.50600 Transcript_25897/m.50600 type:complete len:304 (+) Transcript_25897:144-1055(+)
MATKLMGRGGNGERCASCAFCATPAVLLAVRAPLFIPPFSISLSLGLSIPPQLRFLGPVAWNARLYTLAPPKVTSPTRAASRTPFGTFGPKRTACSAQATAPAYPSPSQPGPNLWMVETPCRVAAVASAIGSAVGVFSIPPQSEWPTRQVPMHDAAESHPALRADASLNTAADIPPSGTSHNRVHASSPASQAPQSMTEHGSITVSCLGMLSEGAMKAAPQKHSCQAFSNAHILIHEAPTALTSLARVLPSFAGHTATITEPPCRAKMMPQIAKAYPLGVMADGHRAERTEFVGSPNAPFPKT